MRQVPELNSMHEEFAEEGLVVVGVTNESAQLVADKVSGMDMLYPIARVTGSSVDSSYGIKAFPTAYVIAPDGTVAWARGSSRSKEEVIRELLPSAVMVQPLEGKQYRSINKELANRNLGKAYKLVQRALEKTPGDTALTSCRTSLEGIFEAQLQGVDAAVKGGAFADALRSCERLEELFDGCRLVDQVEQLSKAIRKDPDAADDLSADALLQKAKKSMATGKKAKIKSAYSQLEKLVEKYPDTATARRAEAMLRNRSN